MSFVGVFSSGWFYIGIVWVILMGAGVIVYRELASKDRLTRDLLKVAAKEDGCSELFIFFKAAGSLNLNRSAAKLLNDYTKYSLSGSRGIYPSYLREYLKNRYAVK